VKWVLEGVGVVDGLGRCPIQKEGPGEVFRGFLGHVGRHGWYLVYLGGLSVLYLFEKDQSTGKSHEGVLAVHSEINR
jgi:hypothetical protein